MTPARQPQLKVNSFEGDYTEIETDEFMGVLTISNSVIPELIERLQAITHTSAPAPDKPKFGSEDLLLLAHDEWKRREERKHLHNERDWVSGFIGGFRTDPAWARKMVDKIRAAANQQQEGVSE